MKTGGLEADVSRRKRIVFLLVSDMLAKINSSFKFLFCYNRHYYSVRGLSITFSARNSTCSMRYPFYVVVNQSHIQHRLNLT